MAADITEEDDDDGMVNGVDEEVAEVINKGMDEGVGKDMTEGIARDDDGTEVCLMGGVEGDTL